MGAFGLAECELLSGEPGRGSQEALGPGVCAFVHNTQQSQLTVGSPAFLRAPFSWLTFTP